MKDVLGIVPVAGTYRSASSVRPSSSVSVALLVNSLECVPAPCGSTLLTVEFVRTVTPTFARYFSAFAARWGRNTGKILGPDVTTVMAHFGCAGLEPNQPARPFRYSPSSPAVSIPAGPPPAIMMLLALGRAARNCFQFSRRTDASDALRP